MKHRLTIISAAAITIVLYMAAGVPGKRSSDDPAATSAYNLFRWQWEPREKAFKLLIPHTWIIEGGIFRIDPVAGGGAANAIEAKLDLSIKSDRQGTIMMRWFPDMFYFDPRYSPAGQMGLIRPGTNYNGMMVCTIMPPEQFIAQIVLPYAHGNASDVRIIHHKSLPGLAKAVEKEDNLLLPMGFTYSAAMVHLEYTENSACYEEKIVTVIINLGQAGAGMWKNRYTFSIRTPKGELSEHESMFTAIGNSVTLNNAWVTAEIRGQMERAGILDRTLAEINRIGREIADQRNRVNSIIQNDMYLTLTGQEEYVNPFTREIEIGTNQWKYRWSSNSDSVIYSDDPNFDPNRIPELNHYEFRKSPVRQRTP